jgi:hypothetical protein
MLSVVFAVSTISAEEFHMKHISERRARSTISATPLVTGQYSDIDSCQVIYHDGSQDFTYGNAGQNEGVAGTNSYGSSKTLKNYKGYELCCQVNLMKRRIATVSLPVVLSDFSADVQKALALHNVAITNANQINGSLTIQRDQLALLPR